MNKNKRVYNIFKNPLKSAESVSSAFQLNAIGTRMTRIRRILTDFLNLFKFFHLLIQCPKLYKSISKSTGQWSEWTASLMLRQSIILSLKLFVTD